MIFLLEILEPYISIHYVRDTIDTKYYVIINQKTFPCALLFRWICIYAGASKE